MEEESSIEQGDIQEPSENEVRALEAQMRKAEADEAAAKARLDAEKEKGRRAKAARRAKGRGKALAALKGMSKAAKLAFFACIAAVVVFAILFLPGILSSRHKGVTISEAALKDAVSISKLSTAEFTYNGIAEKTKDNGNVEYYIYYEATAKSEADLGNAEFMVDDEAKTVTVTLPSITIGSPVIDESAIEFLPKNPNVQLREVIEVCKQDVQRELETTSRVREVAERNLRDTLDALLKPIVGSEGYALVWESVSSADQEEGTDEDSQ